MHQLTRPSALLGGQQALRLQQLQELSDDLVRRTHLQRQQNQQPRGRPPASDRAPSRTVEAVLDARREQQLGGSTAARLRNKIDEARGSVRTERSERRDVPDRHSREPLLPHFPRVGGPDGSSEAPVADDGGDARTRPTVTRWTIGAVRRCADDAQSADPPRRRLTKQQLAWVEKQLQFTQRATVLERECESWWRQFFGASSAGVSSGFAPSSTIASAAAIQRALDELPTARAQDTRLMMQQLQALRAKLARVAQKLGEMRGGETYCADLQQRIEELEAAIAAFRLAQRERFDEYALAEKVLEKELRAFADRMGEWEAEPRSRPAAPTVRRLATAAAARDCEEDPASEGTALQPPSGEADLLAHVRRLNELLVQTGGERGGWDEREHRVFTSLLLRCGLTDDVLAQQHPNQRDADDDDAQPREPGSASAPADYEAVVARFLRKCIAKVATRSDAAVRGHLLWYADHVQLLQQKKDAVVAWKARRQRERRDLVRQGLVGGGEDAESGSPPPGRGRAAGGRRAEADDDEEQRRVLGTERQARKAKQLSEWREHKRLQEQEAQTRERAAAREREALDAKRKQEQLDAKQKVLLYRLQKEQEAAANSASSQPQDDSPSPAAREELVARSRQAIASAKAKRAKLQALEARRLRQSALPARPPSARQAPASADASPLLLQATKASQARGLSKLELRARDTARRRLLAHDAFFPGADALPDVRAKSFGHAPIQPRAVPAWRRGV